MPASMSSARADALAEREARLVDELATIRPSTRPGASPTHSTWRPSDGEERARRARAAGVGGRRAARELDEPRPSGGSAWKPAALPPGSSARERRRRRTASACGPPCSGASSVGRAAVDDQRGHARRSASTGVGDAQPASRGRVAQLVGQRAVAARSRRARRRRRPAPAGRVVGPVRPSSGYSYQPRPVLRPWPPGGDHARGQRRRAASAARRSDCS